MLSGTELEMGEGPGGEGVSEQLRDKEGEAGVASNFSCSLFRLATLL